MMKSLLDKRETKEKVKKDYQWINSWRCTIKSASLTPVWTSLGSAHFSLMFMTILVLRKPFQNKVLIQR